MECRENKQRVIIYIGIFAFFCLLYFRIPLIQDAWASCGLYNNAGNFVNWLKSSLALYDVLNGRTLATVIVGFFERNEFILDISCAVLLTAIVYFYQKCFAFYSIKGTLYVLLAMLAVPVGVRTEVYFYATMIYAVPVASIIMFLICLNKYICQNQFVTLKEYVFFVLVGYVNAAWIEHTSCAFVILFTLFVIYDSLKNRKVNIKLIIAEIIFVVAFMLMMLSPGLRLQRQFGLESKSTVSIIIDNLNLLIQFLFVEHSGMLSILILSCILFAFANKDKFKSIYSRNIYIISMLLWGFLGIRNFMTQSMPWITPVLRVPLLVLFFLEVFLPVIKSKYRTMLLCLYLIGLASLAPVIITPNMSYRVCYYFFIMLNFVAVGIWIDNLNVLRKRSGVISILLVLPALIVMDAYCVVSYDIHNIQVEREELIREVIALQHNGKWDYNEVLVLPLFSETQLYAAASPNKYYDRIHYQVFLNYYHLNSETLVYFGDSYDVLKVLDNKDGTVTLSIKPAINTISYDCQFQMLKDKVVIEESEVIDDNNYQFTIPEDLGTYYFKCTLYDLSGNEISIFSPKVIDKE